MRSGCSYIVDNGSSHRGQASVTRMRRRDKRIILVHTPVHASWLNQVEIYFSIIQRKVLTPNDFATLDAIRLRLALYEQLTGCPELIRHLWRTPSSRTLFDRVFVSIAHLQYHFNQPLAFQINTLCR